jgi:diguanylate cyclase (GGDEF)-like protein/PAS domain S-box-containing protein
MADALPLDHATLPFCASAVANLDDGVYFVDPARRILYWNRAAADISGYAASEVEGRHCFDNLLRHVNDTGAELCHTACPLARTLTDGRTREAEVFLFHKNGHRRAVKVRTVPVRDAGGRTLGAVEVFSDSSETQAVRKKLEELGRMALVDTLTGVGNRRYIEMTLRAKVEEAGRYNNRLGLLFVDIDHFKKVNDRHGHAVGDELLRTVAKTVNDNSRIFDVVGRWGGEEFLLIAPNVSVKMLEAIAERLRALVAQSALPLPDGELRVTVSIGGLVTEGRSTADELVEYADRLMYQAKAAGRNCVVLAPAP